MSYMSFPIMQQTAAPRAQWLKPLLPIVSHNPNLNWAPWTWESFNCEGTTSSQDPCLTGLGWTCTQQKVVKPLREKAPSDLLVCWGNLNPATPSPILTLDPITTHQPSCICQITCLKVTQSLYSPKELSEVMQCRNLAEVNSVWGWSVIMLGTSWGPYINHSEFSESKDKNATNKSEPEDL